MVTKKYKDRLFCMLFGNIEYKNNILSLYNALCNTAHKNPDDIRIYTIDDVIYIKMKNDVSILLDSYLCLWEQQSTVNPNMPVRGLMYYGQMYARYITENFLNIYGKKLVKLPTPRYTVLYNGTDKQPDIAKLRLSDAFINPSPKGDFEWTATMVNLNEGKNQQLLDSCRPLREYMALVNKIRENQKTMPFEEAVDSAVIYCIEHNILKTFLTKHRAEVKEMCLNEFNEKAFTEGIRAEGHEEGLEEGLVKGRTEGWDEIVEIVKRLRSGETPEKLEQNGISPDAITRAKKILQ